MKRLLQALLEDDGGQDLIEYTLLLAFVALSSTGLFLDAGSGTKQIWSTANSVLATASSSTAQATPPAGGGGGGGGGGDGGDGGDGGRH